MKSGEFAYFFQEKDKVSKLSKYSPGSQISFPFGKLEGNALSLAEDLTVSS